MAKLLITTTTFAEYDNRPLNILKNKGFNLVLNPYGRQMAKEEIVNLGKDVIGIIAGTEALDANIIKMFTNLRVISRCGSGLDNIDLIAARRGGIRIFSTPDAPTQAVAELTVGLILSLLRRVGQMDRAMRNKKWQKLTGSLLSGKKVGIIGFGRIGRKVAELLKPFNCEIAYADPFVEDGLLGLTRISKQDLLKWAEVISIHFSAKKRLIGVKELKIFKKGGWLINTSRGKILDEDALYEALKSKHLSGAALDVFDQEPYIGKLTKLENIILTCHIGSYAKEARIEMERQAVNNLLKGLKEARIIK